MVRSCQHAWAAPQSNMPRAPTSLTADTGFPPMIVSEIPRASTVNPRDMRNQITPQHCGVPPTLSANLDASDCLTARVTVSS